MGSISPYSVRGSFSGDISTDSKHKEKDTYKGKLVKDVSLEKGMKVKLILGTDQKTVIGVIIDHFSPQDMTNMVSDGSMELYTEVPYRIIHFREHMQMEIGEVVYTRTTAKLKKSRLTPFYNDIITINRAIKKINGGEE